MVTKTIQQRLASRSVGRLANQLSVKQAGSPNGSNQINKLDYLSPTGFTYYYDDGSLGAPANRRLKQFGHKRALRRPRVGINQVRLEDK